MRSKMQTEDWYSGLDPGIRFAVRVLHARGIDTGQSCEGGPEHSYDHPTVDLAEGSDQRPGFAALAELETYGLRVRDISLVWPVRHGLPTDCFWRITLCQSWPVRADEQPMFVWSYEANAQQGAAI